MKNTAENPTIKLGDYLKRFKELLVRDGCAVRINDDSDHATLFVQGDTLFVGVKSNALIRRMQLSSGAEMQEATAPPQIRNAQNLGKWFEMKIPSVISDDMTLTIMLGEKAIAPSTVADKKKDNWLGI